MAKYGPTKATPGQKSVILETLKIRVFEKYSNRKIDDKRRNIRGSILLFGSGRIQHDFHTARPIKSPVIVDFL